MDPYDFPSGGRRKYLGSILTYGNLHSSPRLRSDTHKNLRLLLTQTLHSILYYPPVIQPTTILVIPKSARLKTHTLIRHPQKPFDVRDIKTYNRGSNHEENSSKHISSGADYRGYPISLGDQAVHQSCASTACWLRPSSILIHTSNPAQGIFPTTS